MLNQSTDKKYGEINVDRFRFLEHNEQNLAPLAYDIQSTIHIKWISIVSALASPNKCTICTREFIEHMALRCMGKLQLQIA